MNPRSTSTSRRLSILESPTSSRSLERSFEDENSKYTLPSREGDIHDEEHKNEIVELDGLDGQFEEHSEHDGDHLDSNSGSDSDVDNCSICLQPITDRTVIVICSHEFCFDCLLVWSGA